MKRRPGNAVSGNEFRRYLEIFHRTYRDTVDRLVPGKLRPYLLRYFYYKGGIAAYLSNTSGVGYEYVSSGRSGISVKRSDDRIEKLLLHTPARMDHISSAAFAIGARQATLCRCGSGGQYPVRLTGPEASVRMVDCFFRHGAWSRQIDFAEMYAQRNKAFWTADEAKRRAYDEIVIALVDIKGAQCKGIDLHVYLANYKQKHVLVLGDYGAEGRIRLRNISEVLVGLGYEPLLVDEIPEHPQYSLIQKVVALGSVMRFVVVDDSSKSGHLVELQHALANNWVTIILRMRGSETSFMTKGADLQSKVVLEQDYEPSALSSVLGESVQWAEETIRDLQRGMITMYPWRDPRQ